MIIVLVKSATLIQTKGLVFIHEKGVAHWYCIRLLLRLLRSHFNSDCVMRNILMDADAMYPEGFHPVKTSYKRDYSGPADYIPRSVAGVRYYFTDFGISVHMPEEDRTLVTGSLGRDQQPPELSETFPYDPFKLDIFIIGNMMKQEFCDASNSQPITHQKTHNPSEVLQYRIP